jgi:hypothetical protein
MSGFSVGRADADGAEEAPPRAGPEKRGMAWQKKVGVIENCGFRLA